MREHVDGVRLRARVMFFCLVIALAGSAKSASTAVEEDFSAPWSGTEQEVETLHSQLGSIRAGDLDPGSEMLFVNRAGRSGDKLFIPDLERIAERAVPREKELIVYFAVRGLAALGVEKDFFFRSAEKYVDRPVLATNAIDAIADPYDQNVLGFLTTLRERAKADGPRGAGINGALMVFGYIRSDARQYERLDLPGKISWGVDNLKQTIAMDPMFRGSHGPSATRWMHGRFQDLCERHPDLVALELAKVNKGIDSSGDYFSPEELQKWVSQYLTPRARYFWEGLRQGKTMRELQKIAAARTSDPSGPGAMSAPPSQPGPIVIADTTPKESGSAKFIQRSRQYQMVKILVLACICGLVAVCWKFWRWPGQGTGCR